MGPKPGSGSCPKKAGRFRNPFSDASTDKKDAKLRKFITAVPIVKQTVTVAYTTDSYRGGNSSMIFDYFSPLPLIFFL